MIKMLLSHQVEDIKSILEERAKHNLFLLNGTNSSCNPGLPSWPRKYDAVHQNKQGNVPVHVVYKVIPLAHLLFQSVLFVTNHYSLYSYLIHVLYVLFLDRKLSFFIRNLRVLKHLLYLPTLPDQSDFAPVKELSHHQLNLLFSHEPRSLSGKKPRFKSINNSFHACKVPFPLFVVF